MSIPAEMAERHGAVLAELAELGLTLARGLHDKALSAETPEAAVELGQAFHQVSRSVRQTLALEARLEREGRRPAPVARPRTLDTPARAAPEPPDIAPGREATPPAPIERLGVERLGVERLGWDEAERPEALETEDLFADLSDYLSAALRDDPGPGASAGRRERRASLDLPAAPRELALAGATCSAGEGWPPPPVPPPGPSRPPACRAAAPPRLPERPGPS